MSTINIQAHKNTDGDYVFFVPPQHLEYLQSSLIAQNKRLQQGRCSKSRQSSDSQEKKCKGRAPQPFINVVQSETIIDTKNIIIPSQ
jgi:hypothetical protein